MTKRKIVETEDGSSSIFSEEINEHYHSIHGARNESQHVFIDYGIAQIKNKELIRVLEVGYGTGLNALLTAIYALENKIKVEYYGIESSPLSKEILRSLAFAKENSEENLYFDIVEVEWNKLLSIHDYFKINKIDKRIQDYNSEKNYFDIVYFDAFSPDAQPEMWTKEIFSKITNSMKTNSLLTTYSVKGEVKRNLKACGMQIKKCPGPKGKREILNALKIV